MPGCCFRATGGLSHRDEARKLTLSLFMREAQLLKPRAEFDKRLGAGTSEVQQPSEPLRSG
jgi:hypothetical protein